MSDKKEDIRNIWYKEDAEEKKVSGVETSTVTYSDDKYTTDSTYRKTAGYYDSPVVTLYMAAPVDPYPYTPFPTYPDTETGTTITIGTEPSVMDPDELRKIIQEEMERMEDDLLPAIVKDLLARVQKLETELEKLRNETSK